MRGEFVPGDEPMRSSNPNASAFDQYTDKIIPPPKMNLLNKLDEDDEPKKPKGKFAEKPPISTMKISPPPVETEQKRNLFLVHQRPSNSDQETEPKKDNMAKTDEFKTMFNLEPKGDTVKRKKKMRRTDREWKKSTDMTGQNSGGEEEEEDEEYVEGESESMEGAVGGHNFQS
jgi:hypothetical protein